MLLWFSFYVACDVDVLEHFVRHANWDPTASVTRTLKNGKPFESKGDMAFEEEKDFNALMLFCPQVVNNTTQKEVLKKMNFARKVKPPRSRTPKGQQAEIYKKEYDGYEEPLRAWINNFRTWMKRQDKKRKSCMTDEEVAAEVRLKEAASIVEIVDTKFSTFHSFHRIDLFSKDAFVEALDEREKEFTALHVHLPDSLGKGCSSSEFEDKLRTMLMSFTDTTRQSGLTVKVWCSPDQENSLHNVMKEVFVSVEKHYWWKAGTEKKTSFKAQRSVPDDVKIGFVGYCEDEKSATRSHNVNKRSRVVVAPATKEEGFQSGHVAKEFFAQHSSQEDLVGDIFCGTGCGAIAAASIGRSSISLDLQGHEVSFFSSSWYGISLCVSVPGVER
jgi:hypothetical protein